VSLLLVLCDYWHGPAAAVRVVVPSLNHFVSRHQPVRQSTSACPSVNIGLSVSQHRPVR
jgi:hypothetical protein